MIPSDELDLINENKNEEIKSKYHSKKTHQNTQYNYYDQILEKQKLMNLDISSDSGEKFILTKREMTPQIKAFLLQAFSNHFIANERSSEEIEKIIANMFSLKIDKGDYIFREGDKPVNFYVLEEGSFSVYKKKKFIKTVEKGGIIGSRSAISDSFRQSDFLAQEISHLWGINIEVYRKIVAGFLKYKIEEYRSFLEKVELFSDLTNEQKNDLTYHVNIIEFKKDDVIIKETKDNEHKISIFLIKSGKIAIFCKNKLNRILEKGETFGENSLLHAKRTYSAIVMSEKLECFTISSEIMDTILGDNIQNIVIKNIKRNTLRHSKYLRHLPPLLIERIINEMIEECYPQGIKLIEKGEVIDKIILIVKGNLTEANGTKYHEGNIILEEALLEENFKNPYDDLIVEGIGLISELPKKTLEKILGSSLENYLKNNIQKDEVEFFEQFQTALMDKDFDKEELKKSDIKVVKEIGEGLTGIVLLVSYKNQLYAMKMISKGWIVENKLEGYLINEKTICEKVNFSLITKLSFTFKDELSIYFMTEFIQGVEFYDLLGTLGIFRNTQARFYIGSLLLAVHYLHMKGIVHRDIKPENIMIDEKGYIKLLHLASGKILIPSKFYNSHKKNENSIEDDQNYKLNKTFTMVGTPHYCAPEMILQKGYGLSVDYWAIGICLFEVLCGYVPFGEDCDNPMGIYKLIIKNKLDFPEYIKDKNVKKLIRQLLSKSPEARTKGSFHSLQSDEWFKDFNWDDLIERKMSAPFVPSKESMISDYEIKKCLGKGITLARLTDDQSLDSIKELTANIQENYRNWDEIF